MLKGVSGRLLEFIESKQLTPSAFASSIGTSDNNVRNFLKGSDSRMSMLLKIVRRYPDLNIDWLVTGRGEMESGLGGKPGAAVSEPPAAYEHRASDLSLAEQKIRSLEELQVSLRDHLKDKERYIRLLEQKLRD